MQQKHVALDFFGLSNLNQFTSPATFLLLVKHSMHDSGRGASGSERVCVCKNWCKVDVTYKDVCKLIY